MNIGKNWGGRNARMVRGPSSVIEITVNRKSKLGGALLLLLLDEGGALLSIECE